MSLMFMSLTRWWTMVWSWWRPWEFRIFIEKRSKEVLVVFFIHDDDPQEDHHDLNPDRYSLMFMLVIPLAKNSLEQDVQCWSVVKTWRSQSWTWTWSRLFSDDGHVGVQGDEKQCKSVEQGFSFEGWWKHCGLNGGLDDEQWCSFMMTIF